MGKVADCLYIFCLNVRGRQPALSGSKHDTLCSNFAKNFSDMFHILLRGAFTKQVMVNATTNCDFIANGPLDFQEIITLNKRNDRSLGKFVSVLLWRWLVQRWDSVTFGVSLIW